MNRTIFFFLNYSKYESGKKKFFSEPRLSRPMSFGKETKYRVNGRLLARSEAADETSPRPWRFIGLKPWRGSRWRESCRNKLDNAPRGIGRTCVRSPDLWFFHYYFARSVPYYVDARISFDSCDLAPNGFPPAKRRMIDVRLSGFHNGVFARNGLRRDNANSAPSTSIASTSLTSSNLSRTEINMIRAFKTCQTRGYEHIYRTNILAMKKIRRFYPIWFYTRFCKSATVSKLDVICPLRAV